MTVRIAYFSWQGHTRRVAEALADALKKNGNDAELIAIEPANGFHIGGAAFRAFLGMKSAIKPAPVVFSGADELVIATPVWAGKVPPYVNAFVAGLPVSKDVPFHVIAEMGGRGAEGAILRVRRPLEKKGMRFVSSLATIEKDVDSGAFTAAVEKFSEGIGKK